VTSHDERVRIVNQETGEEHEYTQRQPFAYLFAEL
jgi:hypothetical protein